MEFKPRLLDNVLPKNATEYERVLASNVDRLLDLDTDRLSNLWNPWTCHVDDLPYLAWSLSVDLWNPNWPESKKRSLIAQSMALHRIKGTEEGIRQHVAIVDSKLLRMISPPARGFYTPALTDAGRRAFLEGLPQVRIYPFMTRRKAPAKRAFYKGSGGIRSHYGDEAGSASDFVQKSDGLKLYGRRSTFYDRGVETPAQYDVLQDIDGLPAERVRISSIGVNRGFYSHSKFGAAFWQKSRASDNVVSIRLSDTATRRYATFTGSVVTDVYPERIYQGRIAPIGRRFYHRRKGFYLSTFGPNLIFDRVTILDKTRLGERQKVRNFWGHTRYGIKPFSAELLVEIPMNRPKAVRGRFVTGFWKKADMTKVDDTLQSIRTSKSFRDTIRIDTQVHRRVRLKDRLPLGSFKLGQIRRLI